MKLMRHSVLFLALIGIFSLSSCDDDTTTTPTEPTPVSFAQKLDATWVVRDGASLPADFDPLESTFSFRFDVDAAAINPVTGEEIGDDGGFFTVFPDADVPRIDYNNAALTGYWEVSDNSVEATSATVTFYHTAEVGTNANTTPGVDGTAITLDLTIDPETLEATEIAVSFTLPEFSNNNPGGEKAGDTVISYTLVKDGSL